MNIALELTAIYEFLHGLGVEAPDTVQANFLDGYQGYLSVDGYQGYGKTQANLVACLAHIRRKFNDAKVAQGKSGKTGKADWALNHIQKLYRIEKQIKDASIDERYRIRQEQAIPLVRLMAVREVLEFIFSLAEIATITHNNPT